MNILALDVSFTALGWAVFSGGRPVACGVIRSIPPNRKQNVYAASANVECGMAMARSLREIIMKHEIRGVVAEIPHGGSKSARASHKMGIALGVVAAVVEMMGLPAEYVQPGDVKLAVCGSRSASKLDVIRKAKSMFGSTLRFPSAARNAEHVADACGAYVACKDTALVRLLSQKEKTRNAAVL